MTEDTWAVYRGRGHQVEHDVTLPDPPPWRDFDGTPGDVDEPEFASEGGAPAATITRAKSYLPEDDAVLMVNTALYLRRPLLVTGKPGTGKSTLAYSVAYELRLGPVLYWPVTSRSQLQDALYRYDSIGRLQQANFDRLQDEQAPIPDIGRFIKLGPLGTALLARNRPRVLLIDELDKSDIDLPNDLLNVLEEGQFEILELSRLATDRPVKVMTADQDAWAEIRQGVVRCKEFPLIIITSNEEREFPPAFLRRCVRLEISPPSTDKLARIVEAQLGEQRLTEANDVVERFIKKKKAGQDLPVDQLLNAVYLTTSGVAPNGKVREDLVKRLFHELGGAGAG